MIVGMCLGFALGFAIVSRLNARPKFLAHTEFWVYLPTEKLPPQEEIMDRMIRDNPYSKGAKAAIGPSEGILFADIRLDIALVLRSKNALLFRPDLAESHVLPTAQKLEALASAKSFAKLRYISEEPLKDKRHLQFLTHAIGAITGLTDSKLYYDVSAEKLVDTSELHTSLTENPDATRPELHIQVLWTQNEEGDYAETKGLAKLGLNEIRTERVEPDSRILVTEILTEAAYQAWFQGSMPLSMEVQAFEDQFVISLLPQRKERVSVARIGRMGSA